MNILAIDSSGLPATAAFVREDRVTAVFTVNNKLTHSQTLLPMIDEMKKIAGLSATDLDAVAVAKGPGSFTGLRIGSATAKGIAQALDLPIVEVSSLEAMAFALHGTDRLICPMMDARRGQVYTGLYRFEKEKLVCMTEPFACPVEEVVEKINAAGLPVMFTGDGFPVYREKIRNLVTVDYLEALPFQNRQNAAALGILAIGYLKEGRTVRADLHAPEYLRLSQAERERAEKEKAERKDREC